MTQSYESPALPSLPDAKNTEDDENYKYQPLVLNDHIRRLVLEPGEGNTPLVGSMEPIRLSEASGSTSFEAISYVWGSNIRNQWITIDGKDVPITTSLSDSLRQVRLPDRPRAVWADALCINQRDNLEKNHQVALMGRIYETSTCSLICLGLDTCYEQDAHDVYNLMEDVNTMIDQVFQDSKFSWDWNSFPMPQRDDRLVTDLRWKAWGILSARPWFKRGWVVQEAALGPDARVLWAGVELSWMRILRTDNWRIWRARPWMPDSLLSLSYISDLQLRQYAAQWRKEASTFRQEAEGESLETWATLEVLDCARDFGLTNQKDRIYAFMALPTSDGPIAAYVSGPEYGEQTTHLDVYRDFTIQYLEKTWDLDILLCVEYEDDDSFLESISWVPRWDCRPEATSFYDTYYDKIDPDDQRCRIDQDRFRLHTRAIIIDSVVYVSNTMEKTNDPADQIKQVVSLWRDVAPEAATYSGPHNSRAFLQALGQGMHNGEHGEFIQSQAEFAKRLQADHEQEQQHRPVVESYTEDANAQRLIFILSEYSKERRLLLLGRGYYGLSSPVTQVGDVCAIIPGTRSPVILRRASDNSNQYKLVGPAWVHRKGLDESGMPKRLGVPGGEDWRDWELPVEDIILY